MSGYLGNPDAEAEHALILAENGVRASQYLLNGPTVDDCVDCGLPISPRRVAALKSLNMKCVYCIDCQPQHDNVARIRLLDRIL